MRTARRHASRERLALATTTSLVDTGLLPALLAPFSRRHGIQVEVLRVGSGAALRLVHIGQADVVVVHAPAAEERAAALGDTVNRREVMTNDFVLVGPHADPAGVRGCNIRTALRRIAAARAAFVSRADGSGTHERECQLWAAARVTPGTWHWAAQGGMAEVLRRANETDAYTLTDRGTLAARAPDVSLAILCSGDSQLVNVYSVLAANPSRHESANYLAAMALIAWLTAPPAQELISTYRVGGHRIVQPAADGTTKKTRTARVHP